MGNLVDLADGGSRKDVVELVEEERLPGFLQFCGGVLGPVEGGEREQGLGLEQAVLGLAVELLDLRLGGEGAAVELEIELARPPREAGFREPLEKILNHRHAQPGHGGEALEAGVVLEHLLGGAAAPGAPAPGEYGLGAGGRAPQLLPG